MKKRLALAAAVLATLAGVGAGTSGAAITDRLQDGTGDGPGLIQAKDGTGLDATHTGGSGGVPAWAAFHGGR